MKILIAGDSWAMGEWPVKQEDGIQHKGLEQYLLDDGHDVVNISEAGDTLTAILHCLKLQQTKYDYVFVFLVEPFAEMQNEFFWDKKLKYEDYYTRHKTKLTSFVKSIDTLNLGPIKLIGGSAKCLPEYITDTSIEIAIPSVIELLIPGLRQYEMNFQYHYHLLDTSNVDQITIDKILEQAEKWDRIYKNPIMHPDGEHPNREGHYKIYQVLKSLYL